MPVSRPWIVLPTDHRQCPYCLRHPCCRPCHPGLVSHDFLCHQRLLPLTSWQRCHPKLAAALFLSLPPDVFVLLRLQAAVTPSHIWRSTLISRAPGLVSCLVIDHVVVLRNRCKLAAL